MKITKENLTKSGYKFYEHQKTHSVFREYARGLFQKRIYNEHDEIMFFVNIWYYPVDSLTHVYQNVEDMFELDTQMRRNESSYINVSGTLESMEDLDALIHELTTLFNVNGYKNYRSNE